MHGVARAVAPRARRTAVPAGTAASLRRRAGRIGLEVVILSLLGAGMAALGADGRLPLP